jgi:hypothetical protein
MTFEDDFARIPPAQECDDRDEQIAVTLYKEERADGERDNPDREVLYTGLFKNTPGACRSIVEICRSLRISVGVQWEVNVTMQCG